jgi:hypothetical protein
LERITDRWQARLPQELLAHVVWRVRLQTHHDDSVPASKWHGYDWMGSLCDYRHRFSQWDASLDGEDDEPFVRLQREEDFEVWRTHLGTWVRRVQRVEDALRRAGIPRNAAGSPMVQPGCATHPERGADPRIHGRRIGARGAAGGSAVDAQALDAARRRSPDGRLRCRRGETLRRAASSGCDAPPTRPLLWKLALRPAA